MYELKALGKCNVYLGKCYNFWGRVFHSLYTMGNEVVFHAALHRDECESQVAVARRLGDRHRSQHKN